MVSSSMLPGFILASIGMRLLLLVPLLLFLLLAFHFFRLFLQDTNLIELFLVLLQVRNEIVHKLGRLWTKFHRSF
ncbi:hypothetical protein PsorP6_012438 [Peronosclerospora sorghi]|uniref:Uncharacterized protein n=1 Tax=Peronosclerospora sorghi TaxID=230839 RepID=A0ACC0WFV1_9STRA|nr:hypothetical protein PsorP6_012438 [Peronosclerospora sorghi]